MNGHAEGLVWGYVMPIWCVMLIVVDCVAFVGLAVWGFFAIRKALRSEEAVSFVNSDDGNLEKKITRYTRKISLFPPL